MGNLPQMWSMMINGPPQYPGWEQKGANINIAMEAMVHIFEMVMSHSYVNWPEGKHSWLSPTFWIAKFMELSPFLECKWETRGIPSWKERADAFLEFLYAARRWFPCFDFTPRCWFTGSPKNGEIKANNLKNGYPLPLMKHVSSCF